LQKVAKKSGVIYFFPGNLQKNQLLANYKSQASFAVAVRGVKQEL